MCKKESVCFNDTILVIMYVENKKRSHRYDINRFEHRHGHRYTKYKLCLSMMILICIKQNLSNVWSSNYEKNK